MPVDRYRPQFVSKRSLLVEEIMLDTPFSVLIALWTTFIGGLCCVLCYVGWPNVPRFSRDKPIFQSFFRCPDSFWENVILSCISLHAWLDCSFRSLVTGETASNCKLKKPRQWLLNSKPIKSHQIKPINHNGFSKRLLTIKSAPNWPADMSHLLYVIERLRWGVRYDSYNAN